MAAGRAGGPSTPALRQPTVGLSGGARGTDAAGGGRAAGPGTGIRYRAARLSEKSRKLLSSNLAGKTVIDYGCGSGILAVAALRLGAAGVWAVDHDPQAWDATGANARKNGVAERLRVCAPEQMPGTRADVVLANILAKTLIDLQPTLCRLVSPGGDLVLSGILADQAPSVMAAYRADADLDPPHRRDKWVLLHARRR